MNEIAIIAYAVEAPRTIAEMSTIISGTRWTVARVLDRLVQRGLITRTPAGRTAYYGPTASGLAYLRDNAAIIDRALIISGGRAPRNT